MRFFTFHVVSLGSSAMMEADAVSSAMSRMERIWIMVVSPAEG